MRLRAITRNLWWKVASLAASFGLWMVYSGARELTTSITAPVQYRNIPEDLEISSDIVEQVHLILRGPSPLLSRLSASDLPVILDLSQIHGPGQTTFTLGRRNVPLSAGITLERAVPSQVRVRMDERLSKLVPVAVQFENLAENLVVESVQITPDRLAVVGPKSHVNQIDELDADPINLAGVATTAERRTTAFSGNPKVTFRSPPNVTVRVTLRPR